MHIYNHIENIGKSVSKPHIVFEIGCNVGTDTDRIYKILAPCTYYAFEPDPNNNSRFEKSPVAKNVNLIKSAVGDTDGTVTFHQCDCIHPTNKLRFTGASSIFEPTEQFVKKYPWVDMTSKVKVPICTLDTFIKKHNIVRPITFIWCDAQGAEGHIIKGATETLKRTRFIYLEFLPEELYKGCLLLDQILKLLPGWSIVEQYKGDILLKNTNIR